MLDNDRMREDCITEERWKGWKGMILYSNDFHASKFGHEALEHGLYQDARHREWDCPTRNCIIVLTSPSIEYCINPILTTFIPYKQPSHEATRRWCCDA